MNYIQIEETQLKWIKLYRNYSLGWFFRRFDDMKYVPGQHINYKNYSAQIVFCYPCYKKGKDAYTIKFIKGGTEFHRLCMEEELSEEMQVQFNDIL